MTFLPTDQVPKIWDSECAKWLRDLLQSEKGNLMLQWIAYQAPALLDGSDVNKTLVASGEVKGYSAAIFNLVKLTVEQPIEKPESTNYPDLDNDAAWADVDKSKESQN